MSTAELVTLEQVEDVLLHGGKLAVIDDAELQADMVRRILEAPDLSTAFQEFKSTAADDIAQQLIEISAVSWMRSGFKEGPAVYAMLDVTVIHTGERVNVSMGGTSIMASLIWAVRNDALPLQGSFYKEASKSNPDRKFWTFKLAPVEG